MGVRSPQNSKGKSLLVVPNPLGPRMLQKADGENPAFFQTAMSRLSKRDRANCGNRWSILLYMWKGPKPDRNSDQSVQRGLRLIEAPPKFRLWRHSHYKIKNYLMRFFLVKIMEKKSYFCYYILHYGNDSH